MANTFKLDTNADLTTNAISDAAAVIVTAGASATNILLSVLVSNKTGSSANVDIQLDANTGDDVFLIRNAPVPAGSSLEIISGNKLIMESSDILRARSDTASALDIAVSYLEQT
jgi:secreted protein with Ig-like and vWFA domain